MSEAPVTVTSPSPPPAALSRVIVTFRIASADTDSEKQAAIARGREALLRELAGTSYRVNRAFETIPAVALGVSDEALQVLRESSNVIAIEEDAVSRPS